MVSISSLGGRKFLHIGPCSIPIDRIKAFDWHAANGGMSDGQSVRIITDDPDDDYVFVEFKDELEIFVKAGGLNESSDL